MDASTATNNFMVPEEILLKAIDKACAGGFDGRELYQILDSAPRMPDGRNTVLVALARQPQSLIFRHDFAKGFWGEASVEKDKKKWLIGADWEIHIKQLAVSRDPLQYLNKFL